MKKILKYFWVAMIVLVASSGVFLYLTQEKTVDLGDGWKSYKYRKIGFTVKIPSNTTTEIDDEFWDEFPTNLVLFSDGMFKQMSSRDYTRISMLATSKEESKNELMSYTKNKSGRVVFERNIKGQEVFFETYIPEKEMEYNDRHMTVYVLGEKYLHYIRNINFDYINENYDGLENLSVHERIKKHIEIISEYLLEIDPF